MSQPEVYIPNPFQLLSEKLQIIESAIDSLHSKIDKNESVKTKEEDERLMNIVEAADVLKVSTSTMYRFCGERTIPYIKKRGKLLFLRKDLIKWAESGRQKTAKEIKQDSETWLGKLGEKKGC